MMRMFLLVAMLLAAACSGQPSPCTVPHVVDDTDVWEGGKGPLPPVGATIQVPVNCDWCKTPGANCSKS